MNELYLIGYWHSIEQPYWPDPGHLVDPEWSETERVAIAKYLDSGFCPFAAAGLSWCRFGCKEAAMGSAELTDGRYLWPEGLSHYVMKHRVRLPSEFIQFALSDPDRGTTISHIDFNFDNINTAWWLSFVENRPPVTCLSPKNL